MQILLRLLANVNVCLKFATPRHPSDFHQHSKIDWWAINTPDQTFLNLVNTPFSSLAACRRGRMKNVSGEFTALSLAVQPLCHS